MALATFRDSAATTPEANGVTSVAVSLAVLEDDLLFLVVPSSETGGGTTSYTLDDDGWEELANLDGSSGSMYMLVLWKRQDVDETLTVTTTFADSKNSVRAALLAYRTPVGLRVEPRLVASEDDGNRLSDYGLLTATPSPGATVLHVVCFSGGASHFTFDQPDPDAPELRVDSTRMFVQEGESGGTEATYTVDIVETGQKFYTAALVEIVRLAPAYAWHPTGTFRPSRVYEDPFDKAYPQFR